MGSLGKLRGKFEATGLLCKFKLVLGAPGQCQAGVRQVWSDGWRGVWGRTFAVHATAPRPARHEHLVLVATGVTALPAEPRGTRAAARVHVTVALLALATWGGGRVG